MKTINDDSLKDDRNMKTFVRIDKGVQLQAFKQGDVYIPARKLEDKEFRANLPCSDKYTGLKGEKFWIDLGWTPANVWDEKEHAKAAKVEREELIADKKREARTTAK